MKRITRPKVLNSEIGKRFALYMASAGLVIALVLSSLISYRQYRNRLSFLESELNNIVKTSRSSIEQSLWILDTRTLDLIVQGVLLNRDIVFARITDEEGKTIVSKGNLDNEDVIKKTISLYHQEGDKNIFLGKLTVAISKKSAFKEAISSIIITLAQSVLLMFIISICVIYLFWHLVSRHLIEIKQYTKNLKLGTHQDPLTLDRPINKRTKNDELASTVEAINFMYSEAQKAYQKLEAEVSERLKLERQLRQAQKMESIGRLAGGIAHDFNNILTVIIGHCELLLANMAPDDPERETIKTIHEAGEKAAALTRQLLAFSRKQVLEKKVISINEIVENFLKILGNMVGEDIIFTTHLSEASCTVEADPGQIEQIILNLVVNAKDAMPKGGEIIIETAEIEIGSNFADSSKKIKPGQYVLLTISDTGKGMTEDVLSKIFDPFFTTKKLGKGTGLGLSTVYGIVKQHNGYIFAYSEKYRGTTFKIYFPACGKTADEEESKLTTKVLPSGNETILIVDDNTSICKLIVETLRPLGYKCLQVTSARKAVDLLREYSGEVHLLLTDVVMPGMSGRELAETILKERPEIKVIYMSGYTDEIIARHGVLEKGLNYIAKPITPVALAQKIRSVLNMNPRNRG